MNQKMVSVNKIIVSSLIYLLHCFFFFVQVAAISFFDGDVLGRPDLLSLLAASSETDLTAPARHPADIDVSRWPIDSDHPVTGIGLADVFGLKGSKNSMILTRLLRDHQPNLIWSARREVIDYINLERDQLVNHFPRAPFNTKVGEL